MNLVSDTVPPWAHEKPVIEPHDPGWSYQAAVQRALLVDVLEPWLVDGVEHVGSTTVPGLAAKPVIDLMASPRHFAGTIGWRAGTRR
jgi:GrpB-like predicted nucleotidyltransferase (UPF0157 family)